MISRILVIAACLICSDNCCNILGFKYIPPPSQDLVINCQSCAGTQLRRLKLFDQFSPSPCCSEKEEQDLGRLKNATGCGLPGRRIVGGEEAGESQIPWQCAVLNQDNTFYGCGASILSCQPLILISAAHCFQSLDRSAVSQSFSLV